VRDDFEGQGALGADDKKMALVSLRKYGGNKKLKRLLVGVVIVCLGALTTLFIGHRRLGHQQDALLPAIESQADMTIQKVDQTAVRNGIKEWHLKAEAAELMEAEKKLILEKPSVEFFLEDGNTAILTAERGVLWMDTRNMDVNGNVLVQRGHYKLETSRLIYEHDTRKLSSQAPVHIVGQGFSMDSQSMIIDLTSKRGLFAGGVEGWFRDKLNVDCTFRASIWLSAAILILFGLSMMAKAQDANPKGEPAAASEPIRITSERLVTDSKENSAEFSGHVQATQGNTVITAQRLKIFYQSNGAGNQQVAGAESLRKIIATGDVEIKFDNRVAVTQEAVYITDEAPGPDRTEFENHQRQGLCHRQQITFPIRWPGSGGERAGQSGGSRHFPGEKGLN
jgi:LPS export ABC transporter protein LptC